jgi:hypothetical protein
MAGGRRVSMQDDVLSALVRDHQQQLRQAAREAAVRRALRREEGKIGPRPLPLRLLDRIAGPH